MKRRIVSFSFVVVLCFFYAVVPFTAQEAKKEAQVNFDLDTSMNQLLQTALSTPEYPATPGDVYQLTYVAGSVTVSSAIVLDATYTLKVHNLGVLDARGKTYLQLKAQVENLVSKNYPLSGVQFSLMNPGLFKVLVKGEVTVAGQVNVNGLTRVSDLFGRATAKGSMRNVQVTSASGKISYYDIFSAQRTGNLNENPYVRHGDVITILPLDRKVTISGEVYRPGSYQLLKGETAKTLITEYGDGFKYDADQSFITVMRVNTGDSIPGKTFSMDYEEFSSFTLVDGDTVHVNNISDKRKVVFFEGAIKDSNSLETRESTGIVIDGSGKVNYRFYDGLMLSTAVYEIRNQFLMSAAIAEAYVIRNGMKIPVNFEDFLYRNNFSNDMLLENGDTVVVPFRQYFVIVSGSVKNPGKYAYIPDRDYQYYIDIAGGIDEGANNGFGIRVRDLHGNKLSTKENIPAEALIYVPANRFTYFVNRYMSIVTLLISIITLVIAII